MIIDYLVFIVCLIIAILILSEYCAMLSHMPDQFTGPSLSSFVWFYSNPAWADGLQLDPRGLWPGVWEMITETFLIMGCTLTSRLEHLLFLQKPFYLCSTASLHPLGCTADLGFGGESMLTSKKPKNILSIWDCANIEPREEMLLSPEGGWSVFDNQK